MLHKYYVTEYVNIICNKTHVIYIYSTHVYDTIYAYNKNMLYNTVNRNIYITLNIYCNVNNASRNISQH